MGVTKRKRGGKEYYYLYHDSRKNGRKQRDRYLGTKIPEDVEEQKVDFEREIYLEDWESDLEKIYQNYKKEKDRLSDKEWDEKNRKFSMKFNYDTQKIEGSKLTLKETIDLLDSKISPKKKPMHDIRETEAHDKIFEKMMKHVGDLDEDLVVGWHKELLQDTEPEKAGKIRTTDVAIRGSDFSPPPGYLVRKMLNAFFVWYEKNKMKIHPVMLAALVHQKFVTVHPFRDGNGRLSRLLMNFILKKHCYPLINIDSGKRNQYYRALESSQIHNNENKFLRWLVKKYLEKNRYAP